MIKTVTLHNLQSHKDTKVVLCNNINAIIGLSDSGKSAFLRGLKALLYRDSFYVRAFEEEAFVEIEFDNGIVRREKQISFPKKCQTCKEKIEKIQKCQCGQVIEPSITADKYIINGQTIEKFGVKLPEQIKNILKFQETNFVDFEVALQFFSQHEDMFFIGQSYAGGARNKIMSCLVPDSDKIDIILKKVNSDIQEKKILSESLLLENIQLENRIKSGLPVYEEVEALNKEIELLTSSIGKSGREHANLISIRDNLKRLECIDKQVKNIETISGNIKKIKEFYENKFLKTKEQYTKLSSISKIPKHIQLPDIEVPKFDISELKDIESAITKIKRASLNLNETNDKTKKLTQDVQKFNTAISDLKSKHNECLGKSLCPVIQDKFCDTCIERLKV